WIGLSSIPGLKKIIASLIGLLSKDKAIMSYIPYFNPSNIHSFAKDSLILLIGFTIDVSKDLI
ncbi:MAG: hypothetical protein AAGC64_13740, partial [Bacteroidota bacterium]